MIYINISYRKKHDPIGLCFHNNRQPPVIFLLLDNCMMKKRRSPPQRGFSAFLYFEARNKEITRKMVNFWHTLR